MVNKSKFLMYFSDILIVMSAVLVGRHISGVIAYEPEIPVKMQGRKEG